MARLRIQCEFEWGKSVCCGNTVSVPVGRRISYQRTPVTELLLPPLTVTEWLTTSASCPSLNLRQASRYISRSANESSLFLVLGWGIQAPPPEHAAVNAATGMVVGPVKVELAGVVKSTWNFHRLSTFEPKFREKYCSPAAGAIVPSRSYGNRLPTLELCWKQTWVAAAPARIAALSNAHARAPTKVLPLNMLNDV